MRHLLKGSALEAIASNLIVMASNLVAKTSDNVQFVLFARVQTGLASWMSTVKAVSAGRPIDSTSQHHHPKTLY